MHNILLIGSGGREHALAWKLSQSPRVAQIYVAPGNGGTATLTKTQNIDIGVLDFDALKNFAKTNNIYMTVVGPDDPLALGIVDSFTQDGLRIWGPTQAAAQIEASKAFSKELMQEAGIPTAAFKIFKASEHVSAMQYIDQQGAPIVVKASGLALGKGAIVCATIEEAKQAIKEIAIDKTLGAAGDEIVIEEFLDGPEISIHAFCDGKTARIFPSSQDHKTIGEGDTGPNTGGMGTIAPLPWVNAELIKKIEKEILEPTLAAMKKAGREFKGLLYPGLMLSSKGIRVLEYNARFGDPETQSYMRLLETDLLDILDACVDGKLADLNIQWSNNSASTVVLASAGYPGKYEKGKSIIGIDQAELDTDVIVFHAGTKIDLPQNRLERGLRARGSGVDEPVNEHAEGEYNEVIGDLGASLKTNGGRVLGVTATGKTLDQALAKAYKAADKIQFEGKTLRRDIGAKSLAIL